MALVQWCSCFLFSHFSLFLTKGKYECALIVLRCGGTVLVLVPR